MAADTPTPLSYELVLSQIVDAFLSRTGLSGLKVAGPLLSLMEAAAQSDARAAGDVFGVLAAIDPRTARGEALDRLGAARRLPRLPALAATGKVTVYDSTITRIATRLSKARPAPIAGATSLDVTDASSFTNTGSVYIARGTASYEGPLPYTSKTNNGSYWTLALSSPTVRFHAQGEEVVLAQGGQRVAPGGSVVQTRRGAREPVQFVLLYGATIPDGEREVQGVRIAARQPGPGGNVPAGSIVEFGSAPFPGAACTNTQSIGNGRKVEPDETYAERLAKAEAARAGNTSALLESAVVGARDEDGAAVVTEAVYLGSLLDVPTLMVDDGTAHEPTSIGVAREVLVEEALGGETRFQVAQRPLARARLVTEATAPFSDLVGKTLALKVGGESTEHTFSAAEVVTGSAEEVASATNDDSALGWRARAVDGATKVLFEARVSLLEDVECVTPSAGTASDANAVLQLPAGRADTVALYLDGVALSKDGDYAQVQGQPQGSWGTLSGSQTLICAPDSTALITYTITDADFAAIGTYTTVGTNTPAAWAAVLNAKIPGLTFSTSLNGLLAQSNLGRSARARVKITGGTLVTAKVLPAADVSGRDRDYVLDAASGTIELVTPLTTGQRLEAGISDPRAYVRSTAPGTVELASDGNIWFSADATRQEVQTGASSATPLALGVPAAGTKPWGYRWRITSAAGHFSSAARGDWLTLWDSAVNSSLRGTHRLADVAGDGSYVEVERVSNRMQRSHHRAVTLANGKVLVTGGFTNQDLTSATKSCELYDPATQLWTPVADMINARADHTATLLADGKVFVFGGRQTGTAIVATTAATPIAAGEVYDPAGDTWTAVATASQPAARFGHAAAKGVDDKVYLWGGFSSTTVALATGARYAPGSDAWEARASMGTARALHTLTKLSDDKLYAVGGQGASDAVLDTTEAHDAGANSWASAGTTQSARQGARASLLATGKLLYAGGSTTAETSPTPSVHADLYEVGVGWSNAASMGRARSAHGQCILSGGKVLVSHGTTGGTISETYDAGGDAWTACNAPDQTTAKRYQEAAAVGTNQAVVCGGVDGSGYGHAAAELYTLGTNSWTRPDPATSASLSLAASGIVLDRLGYFARPLRSTVPSGTGYTSSSLATELQTDLTPSLKAATALTTKIQVSTPTFAAATDGWSGKVGDVAVLAADVEGQKLKFSRGQSRTNSAGPRAAVQCSNPCLGTPLLAWVRHLGASAAYAASLSWRDIATTNLPTLGHWLVGLDARRDSSTLHRAAADLGIFTQTTAQTYDGLARGVFYAAPRTVLAGAPGGRCWLAAPWSLGPADELVVVANGDAELSRHAVPCYRACKPTGSYGQQVTLKDYATGSSVALSVAYGTVWDFRDFALYMRPRAKTHGSDASKRVLWRWWRRGAEDSVTIEYALPLGPDRAVTVETDDVGSASLTCSVRLKSGAQKTGETLRPGTRVGVATPTVAFGIGTAHWCVGLAITTASRTANVTTLTPTLPSGITNHGISSGWAIYVNSSHPAFSSGVKVVTGVTATTLTYAEVDADQGATASIGTLSVDIAEAKLDTASPSYQAGDFLRIGTGTEVTGTHVGMTTRLTAVATQHVTGKIPWSVAATTTLSWGFLKEATAWQAFANSSQTATQLVADVQALYAAGISPVYGTVTGTGAGTIDRSSWEDASVYPTRYTLADGLNWVKSTNTPLAGADYTFTLKQTVTSDLTSDADWTNEDARLVPLTPTTLASWLASEANSGLNRDLVAEVASAARHVQLSSRTEGSAGSVEVQGGSASSWSASVSGPATLTGSSWGTVLQVPRAGLDGLPAGAWVWLRNATSVRKASFQNTTKLNTWTAAGRLTFDSGAAAIWTPAATSKASACCTFERQGSLLAILDTQQGSSSLDLSMLAEGDYVVVSAPATYAATAPQVAEGNQGTYRVLKVARDDYGSWGCWVVAPTNQVDQESAEADFVFPTKDSVMPGDELYIATDFWGADNRGYWTVKSVGGSTAWASQFIFDVDVTTRTPSAVLASPGVLGSTNSLLVAARDAQGLVLLRQVVSAHPDATDSSLARLRIPGQRCWEWLGSVAGTVVEAADKLAFPTGIFQGQDGYAYSTGLVGAAAKVVLGDPADPVTYPGLLAAGARIDVAPPLLRRVKFGVAVRVRSGVPRDSVAAAVRSAVAGAVNSRAKSGPIPVSELLAAAQAVGGVESVVPTGTYTTSDDVIEVAAGERGKVLDEAADVSVSYLGE